MPFPIQLLGSGTDLLRIPGLRMPRGARTPNTFPGRPTMPRSLSDPIQPPNNSQATPTSSNPEMSTPDDPGSPDAPPVSLTMPGLKIPTSPAPTQPAAAPDVNGHLPMSEMLRQPNTTMTPAEQRAVSDLQQGPPQAHGARRVLGSVLRGVAMGGNWQWLQPAADEISGAGKWRRGVQNDLDQAQIERDAVTRAAQMQNMDLQRQEAQQRITEGQQRAKDAELNAQRTSYDRRMKDIRSVGGFEAPTIPPAIESQQMPMSPLLTQPPSSAATPDDSTVVRNLPMRNLIVSPGLRPEQSSSLGTVEQVTDPDTQETRSMVRPNQRTQQEMQQGGWPKVTATMAATLDDLGLEEGTPVPPATYSKLVQAMQTRQTQAQRPGPRPISVAPGHRLVDDSGNVLYTAPGKPEGDQKPPTRGQFAAIESRKQTALAKAEVDARKRLRGSSTVEPEDADTVYADLANQKQQIQNGYEQEVSALTGGDVGHFDYGQPGTKTSQVSAAQPARQSGARPSSVSEAELRRQAAAAGKDPEAAVRIAKTRGYKLTQ